MDISQETLDSLNVEQARTENKHALVELGGTEALARNLGVNLELGLLPGQVLAQREKFGSNEFPTSPMNSYFSLLIDALSDTTLLILLAAAAVSLIIGLIEEPESGYIEGTAIFIAVALVANISAGNDYTKELQFRALEASSQQEERTSVLRNGVVERLNPVDLVVGDIVVLQAGDMIPADSIILDNVVVKSNESSLTGEPEDMAKSPAKDPFLLSSCCITEGEQCKALVIGIGLHSQWGKIKSKLVTEAVNTPLQDKLEAMTTQIGYIGMVCAVATFTAMVISIWARDGGHDILQGFINAFILAVTIVVVAIPEGLPLAVTIALAFSTKKMYKDQCFIRVLAACETMGNATTICSDKTGTLTENRMTVVEGWFGGTHISQENFQPQNVPSSVKELVGSHVCINRSAYLVYKDQEGNVLDRPNIIGNKTEGALIFMAKSWGMEYEEVYARMFSESRDRVFSFNSSKKRSTAVVHLSNGIVRIFCKGATEWVLKDCQSYMDANGRVCPMTEEKRVELEGIIASMADRALRTLLLSHKDISLADLPSDWMENPPDSSGLIADCIVGIIDPLRGDVKAAVATAQRAGVMVRMVTGDNVATARAIARQCGILTDGGLSIEGPIFRKMAPVAVDKLLPKLQVMARSSPDDKYLLVVRLNGSGLPEKKEDWETMHAAKVGVTWENDRDLLLPGYSEEWRATRPYGGHVVGVTGDGTNDAPALKAADVGLSMGITGTKVAQGASDIVILDDRFSSIVRAIKWGRSVYDNIRKFLQFQLTVNVVALLVVFIGAVAGFEPPLNAVEMLWVNLVMDTFGALALGTEPPTDQVLDRKPYKRTASLISRVMWRNILCMSAYQLCMLMVLLFKGAQWFDVPYGVDCFKFKTSVSSTLRWDVTTNAQIASPYFVGDTYVTCASFNTYCSNHERSCYKASHDFLNMTTGSETGILFDFDSLIDYKSECLTCTLPDYTHNTIIFNTFIWLQIFNEYNSRVFEEMNMFTGLFTESGHALFFFVSIITILLQVMLVYVGGEFVRTTPLSTNQWLITIALGATSLVVAWLIKLIPIKEDPESFFNHELVDAFTVGQLHEPILEKSRDYSTVSAVGNEEAMRSV